MTEARELPVKKISVPKIYWPPAPKAPPVDGWPAFEESAFVSYAWQSETFGKSGTTKVRKAFLEEFGEKRAVPFSIWGGLLQEYGEEWEAIFQKHGRLETRRIFVENVVYVAVY